MATSKIHRPVTRTWEQASAVEGSPAWANITFFRNDSMRLGMVRITGNSTAAPSGESSFTIPTGYLPETNFQIELTRDGGRAEIRTDGALKITTVGIAWCAANLVYLLD